MRHIVVILAAVACIDEVLSARSITPLRRQRSYLPQQPLRLPQLVETEPGKPVNVFLPPARAPSRIRRINSSRKPSLKKPELDTEWWRHTIIYEIIPYSFKDSNGDGIGDLPGITSKVDYLADLGIETIHLTPIYPTEFRDMGYDVGDYCDIDRKFGTMGDFETLVNELKKRNMKLILDFVLNHTSDKHEWFKRSVERIEPYTDYYVWRNAKGYEAGTGLPIPPNNWESLFDGGPGSAWKWNAKRRQFYLHQFLSEQVDLNLRNTAVRNELKKVIKFWLDKGVAGFRLDAGTRYLEDPYFRNNPPNSRSMQLGREENFEVIHDLRTYLDKYNKDNGGIERIFIAEAHTDPAKMRKYYDREGYNVTHFPYTFLLRDVQSEIPAAQLHEMIDSWIRNLPPKAVSTWMTQDHDDNRTGSRIHPLYMDMWTIISMLLPGNVGVYYGQEIGMMNGPPLEKERIRDFSGHGLRDPARLIMQWDNTTSAGFSDNPNPFLPPNPDYVIRNVEFQKRQQISHYQLFKTLTRLRKSDTFIYGDFKSFVISEYVYVFMRSYQNKMLVVITNLYSPTVIIDLHHVIPNLPDMISIVAASENLAYHYRYSMTLNRYYSAQFVSLPYSSVVLEV